MFKLVAFLAVALTVVSAAEYKQYDNYKEAVSFQNYNLKNSKNIQLLKVPVVEKKEYYQEPKYEAKYEVKYEPKYEVKYEPKYVPKYEVKYEPKYEVKYEPKYEPKYEVKYESKYEPKYGY